MDHYSKYIHEFVDQAGQVRYAVALHDGNGYSRPADQRTIALTGQNIETTRDIQSFGGYLSKRKALRRARYLFSDSYVMDELKG